MKSIKYIVAALAVAALATASYATVTVNWGTSLVTYLADSSGSYINGTDEIGTFTGAGYQGGGSLVNFNVFGVDAGGISAGVVNGGAGAASASATAGATFGHAQIYFVMVDNAGGEFIGYVNDVSNTNWKFPLEGDTITITGFDMQSFFANPGVDTTLAAGATVVYGQVGLDSVTAGGPYNLLETVPEPSSIALVVIGLLGGVGMIRRRR
jgi:hypothetical protein